MGGELAWVGPVVMALLIVLAQFCDGTLTCPKQSSGVDDEIILPTDSVRASTRNPLQGEPGVDADRV